MKMMILDAFLSRITFLVSNSFPSPEVGVQHSLILILTGQVKARLEMGGKGKRRGAGTDVPGLMHRLFGPRWFYIMKLWLWQSLAG